MKKVIGAEGLVDFVVSVGDVSVDTNLGGKWY